VEDILGPAFGILCGKQPVIGIDEVAVSRLQARDHLLDGVVGKQVIVRSPGQVVAPGEGEALVQRARQLQVRLVADVADALIAKRPDYFRRGVWRVVVDDDQLPVRVSLCQHAADGVRQQMRPFVGGQNDADQWAVHAADSRSARIFCTILMLAVPSP